MGRADPGTAHPTPKGTAGTLRLPVSLPLSLIPSLCPQTPSLALSPVPSPWAQRDTGELLQLPPCLPPAKELQAHSVTFSKSLSLLSLPSSLAEQGLGAGECRRLQDQGRARMELAGMEPHDGHSSSSAPAQPL